MDVAGWVITTLALDQLRRSELRKRVYRLWLLRTLRRRAGLPTR